MLAFGGLLTSAALLALATLALIFRRPDPPAWTTRAWVDDLMAIGIVALFAVGLGCLAVGAMTAYQEGPDLLDLGLLAAVLVGAVLLWRRLDVRARLKAMEPATGTAAAVPPGANARGPRDAAVTPQPPPSRPTHRAA